MLSTRYAEIALALVQRCAPVLKSWAGIRAHLTYRCVFGVMPHREVRQLGSSRMANTCVCTHTKVRSVRPKRAPKSCFARHCAAWPQTIVAALVFSRRIVQPFHAATLQYRLAQLSRASRARDARTGIAQGGGEALLAPLGAVRHKQCHPAGIGRTRRW